MYFIYSFLITMTTGLYALTHFFFFAGLGYHGSNYEYRFDQNIINIWQSLRNIIKQIS